MAWPFTTVSKYLFSYSFVKDIVILVATNETITFLDLDKKVQELSDEIKEDRRLLLAKNEYAKNHPFQNLPLNNDIPWISSQFSADNFQTIANTALLVTVGGVMYVIEHKTRKGLAIKTSNAKDYLVDQFARGGMKDKTTKKKGGSNKKDPIMEVETKGTLESAKMMFQSGEKLLIYNTGLLRINAHLLGYIGFSYGSFAIKKGGKLKMKVVDMFRTIPYYLSRNNKAKFMNRTFEIAEKKNSRISFSKINGVTYLFTTMGAAAFATFVYLMLEYVFNDEEIPNNTTLANVSGNTGVNTVLQQGTISNHKKLFLLIGKILSRLSDIRKLQFSGSLESGMNTKFGENRDVKSAAFKMADVIITQFLQKLARRGTPSVSTHILTIINILVRIHEYLHNPDGIKLSAIRLAGSIVNNVIDFNAKEFKGSKELFAVNLGVKATNDIHIDAIIDNQLSSNPMDDEDYWEQNSDKYDNVDPSLWEKAKFVKDAKTVKPQNIKKDSSHSDNNVTNASINDLTDKYSDKKVSASMANNLKGSLNGYVKASA